MHAAPYWGARALTLPFHPRTGTRPATWRCALGVLLITTSLPEWEPAFDQVVDAVNRPVEAHYLRESTWLVSTEESTTSWSDRLRRLVGAKAQILVVELAPGYAGSLPPKTRRWLKRHLGPSAE